MEVIEFLGGPNGIRTRVTDVRGRNECFTNFHLLSNSPIFLHSALARFHKLPRFCTNDRTKTGQWLVGFPVVLSWYFGYVLH
jgi:hypothetical protein